MIRAYLGYPGSGKSYGMVEDALELYRKGYFIFSTDYVSFAERVDLRRLGNFEWLLSFDDRGAVLLLDELGLLLFSRNFAKNDESVLKTFVLHRKKGIHLWYSAQYFDQVDKVVREVTNEKVFCCSLGRFYIRFYFTMGTFPSSLRLGFFNREIFDMYDSFSYARQVLKVSKSVSNLIRILRLYDSSLRHSNKPVLSNIMRFLLEKAKRGDEDAAWLYRELSSRLHSVIVHDNNRDLGVGDLVFHGQEVNVHDS